MKRYIVKEKNGVTEITHYIHAPHMDSIRRWITETKRVTIFTENLINGNYIINTNGNEYQSSTTFYIKKWKEPNWITL
jgi:hypothetical protein